MAYNKDAFQLTHLLQEVYTRLEQTKAVTATGGSTTTVIDTTLSSAYLANNFAGYTAFVTKDSAGAGAAPEGEFQRVSAYNETTKTLTVDTAFTVAVAAGDVVTLAKGAAYPLTDVKRICNQVLQKMGAVRQLDSSLTTADNQTEYTVPLACKGKVIDVWLQLHNDDSDDNQWTPIPHKIIPAASGSTETLVIEQYTAGYKIGLEWEGLHAVVSAYADPICEYIPREYVVTYCALEVAKAKSLISPDLLSKLTLDFQAARALFPIAKKSKRVSGFPHWTA